MTIFNEPIVEDAALTSFGARDCIHLSQMRDLGVSKVQTNLVFSAFTLAYGLLRFERLVGKDAADLLMISA